MVSAAGEGFGYDENRIEQYFIETTEQRSGIEAGCDRGMYFQD